MLPEIVTPADAANEPYALYEIPTRQGIQYLRVERNHGSNSHRTIVVTDAERLLRLWNKPQTRSSDWETSSSYEQVQKRFASSSRRPLHLPRVRLRRHLLAFLIGWLQALFTRQTGPSCYELTVLEGENRTLWLLANGAAIIPLECATHHAERLHRLIGLNSAAPVSVDKLLPARKPAESRRRRRSGQA